MHWRGKKRQGEREDPLNPTVSTRVMGGCLLSSLSCGRHHGLGKNRRCLQRGGRDQLLDRSDGDVSFSYTQ